MNNNLLYIFVFLYLIFKFATTFYCYAGHLCCYEKKKYTLINIHEDEIYTQAHVTNSYEDDVF